MDSCFGLAGSRQHGVAVKSKATRWLSYRLLNAPTSFPGSSLFLPRESTLVAAGHVSRGNEFKSHTKRVTQDNRQNPEYHVVVAITRMRTDKTCSAENTWLNHLKNKQHIETKKELRPTKAQNTMNGLHKDSVDSKHQLTQLLTVNRFRHTLPIEHVFHSPSPKSHMGQSHCLGSSRMSHNKQRQKATREWSSDTLSQMAAI